MIKIYAKLIIRKVKTLSDVPQKLYEEVAAFLIGEGYENIVTGGAA